MTASKTIMTAFVNCANDMKREIISDIIATLDSHELMTDDIKEVLTTMIGAVKANKKVKKPPQKRFSGYHLFMKEHRVVVKEQNQGIKPQELTTIVSKAWKDVSEEEKEKLNERAMKLKEAHFATMSSSETSDTEEEKTSPKKEKAPKKEKVDKKEKAPKKEKVDKKEKADKKEKVDKKKKAPPPPEESDDEDIDEPVIEEADSDVELQNNNDLNNKKI